MYHDDCVRVLSCDGENEIVPVVPCRKVVAIACVAVDSDVAFARVGVDEDDWDLGLNGDVACGVSVPVVEEPVDGRPILASSGLDGFIR